MTAYSPIQRNVYNDENMEHFDYDPEKAEEILQSVGCEKKDDGYYYRNGEKLGFVICVGCRRSGSCGYCAGRSTAVESNRY